MLDAPAEMIHARQPELEPLEINRQLTAWRVTAAAEPRRLVVLHADKPPPEFLAAALAGIENALAARYGEPSSFRAGDGV